MDPYVLDRAVTSASLALARARAILRAEPEASPERPLAGHDRVSRRDELRELGDLAERRPDEPMWRAAIPHVAGLVLSRATFVDERREAVARYADAHVVESPIRGERTIAEMLEAVLDARAPELAAAWARAIEASASQLRSASIFHARRRAEAARLLEIDLDRHDAPVDDAPLLHHAARGVLDVTQDVVPGAPRWEAIVDFALGRSGQEGYPSKLSPRWLAASLPAGLLDGLALEVAPTPRALGASSFARALSHVGAAIAAADVPKGLPRCLARAPSDLLVARRAALFGGLVADAAFLARRLELGRAAARAQGAAATRVLIASLRIDAARVLARAIDPRLGDAHERVADLVATALGTAAGPETAYVVPRLRPEGAARLVGAVVGCADRERIVEALDEDWFASPRAADFLRHEHHLHRADRRASEADVDAGLAALRRVVTAL